MVRGTGSSYSGGRSASARSHRRRLRAVGVAGLLAAGLLASCSSNHGTSSSSATTAASGATTTTTAGGSGSGTKFGTLPSPCGKGDAKGATATGVTDTSITIGYGDDAGYAASPGLDKEMSDAMKAMIPWCNAQGGINGRKVIGNYYDAKAVAVSQAITSACNDKVFMLVGQGWVLDSGQETERISCKIASIPAYSVSTAFAHGPGVIQPIPSPGDETPASSAYELAKLYPDAVKKAAFVYTTFPATKEPRDRYLAAFPKAGWVFDTKCDQIYNIAGESDWKPLASNLKSCGITAVVWVGAPNPNFENLLSAAKQVGYTPKIWLGDANSYDSSFAKWNSTSGGAGDDVYVRLATVPFEDAATVPAVQQYEDLIDKERGTKALLGVQATSAFLLWATSVKACGSNVTQRCVLAEASKQKAWTAGGLQAPTDPGANKGATCGVLLKFDGDHYQRVVPTAPGTFDCNEKYLVTGLSTAGLTAAKLNSDRVATEFGTYTPQ